MRQWAGRQKRVVAKVSKRSGNMEGARTGRLSYVRDLDYGDQAYDLPSDPKELVNLIGGSDAREPDEVTKLRRRVDRGDEECLRLRDYLKVVARFRGFDQ